MINVLIINNSPFTIYPDLDGKAETKDTIIIGPKGRETVSLPSEKRLTQLTSELAGKATLRKV